MAKKCAGRVRVQFALLCVVASCAAVVLGLPGAVFAQSSYLTNGTEYAIAGVLPGVQVHPHLSLSASGGYLVWEDNTAGNGLGVSALRLDGSSSGLFSPFRVNSNTAQDQEHPQVALLKGGGAAFVWQGGRLGFQHIYGRFLSTSNTWLSADFQVNGVTNNFQINPAIATLANSNVVVVWASFNQAGSNSLQDVYAQILSPAGQKIGAEFLVNQFTTYNQRTPAIAALPGGGFVVAWVSEQQRMVGAAGGLAPASQMAHPSIDIFARLFSANAQPVGKEFAVNSGSDICANPNVAAGSDGGFVIAWSQKDPQVQANGWDVFARAFNSGGVGGTVGRINTQVYGDQFAPRVSSAGTDYLAVWTSMGQDGSMDGVFGQFLHSDGSANGAEFQVNTTWISKQMHPVVASDGAGQFLVTWASFVGGASGFDLFAQRYVSTAQAVLPMALPYVYVPFVVSNGVYQPQIVVTWPVQAGLAIDHYDLYVDNATTITLTTNTWTMTAANGLTAGSTHTFQVDNVRTDGRKTPPSPTATATTWSGYNWGGIPFEWMATYYSSDTSLWPSANSAVVPGGPTLLQIFLTGGNPQDSSTWLRTSLQVIRSPGQSFNQLLWNTQPGLTYQVQTSSNLVTWVNYQSPRFAADEIDSVIVPMNNLGYYRVMRLR
jgi:hypothetical protein